MLTPISTGLDPEGWRNYWRVESARAGTDWPQLLARAAGVVGALYSLHVSGPSS